MMLPQVFISGLLLLLPGAVDSDVVVTAVVGDPVTLPCIYSTDLGISNSCWGLGECKFFYCARTLIWTNGYRVTYQRSSRYQLKGPISEGNVSLTIENAAQSDSGPYCCVVEIPGSFRYATYSLEVKPEIPTSPPTSPTTITGPTTTGRPTTAGRPTTTGRLTTIRRLTTGRPTTTVKPTRMSTRPIHLPTSPTVSTSTPTTPAQTETHTTDWNTTVTDWNNTVTSSNNSWDNYTESIPSLNPQEKMNKGFSLDITIAALMLLLFVCAMAFTGPIIMKKKSGSLRMSTSGPLRRLLPDTGRTTTGFDSTTTLKHPLQLQDYFLCVFIRQWWRG